MSFLPDAVLRTILILVIIFVGPLLAGGITPLATSVAAGSAVRHSSLVLTPLLTLSMLFSDGLAHWGEALLGGIGMLMTFGLVCSYASLGAHIAYQRGW